MLSKQGQNIVNLSRVLRLIWHEDGISRSMIARSLGIDKSTVTDIVSRLIQSGIVKVLSKGDASPHGGRKPIYLGIHKEFAYVAGIELQPDYYRIVIVDLYGDILYAKEGDTRVKDDNFHEVCISLISTAREVCREKGKALIGVAVGTTGIINPYEGKILYSIPLGVLSTYDFEKLVSQGVNIPVFIENDANCCAWGELAFHKSTTLKNFLYVLVEIRKVNVLHDPVELSVGLGLVLGGKVFYGNSFSAGEFRSVFCSEDDIGQFSYPFGETVHIEENEDAFRGFLTELSKNVAMLVNTLNLDQVFLGGILKRYESQMTPILEREISINWPYMSCLPVRCSIQYSSFEENAVAYGAAGMLLERLFGLPEVYEKKSKFNRTRTNLLANLDKISKVTPSEEGLMNNNV